MFTEHMRNSNNPPILEEVFEQRAFTAWIINNIHLTWADAISQDVNEIYLRNHTTSVSTPCWEFITHYGIFYIPKKLTFFKTVSKKELVKTASNIKLKRETRNNEKIWGSRIWTKKIWGHEGMSSLISGYI